MGGGYRPPSREPRGRWARHIHAKRREWGWSQTRGFEAVREAMGLGPKSRAAYIPIDEGKRPPTPTEEAALLAVYGAPPEESEVPEVAALDASALVVAFERAIDRQTQAIVSAIATRDQTIEGLLTELAKYREQQQGLVETVVAALEQRLSATP